MLTQERLKELLHYDPATGVFTWRIDRYSNKLKGKIAGTICDGYIRIKIDEKSYFAQRLVFLYQFGEMPKYQIDHWNRDRTDNKLANLREATILENRKNRKTPITNSSGYKGVHCNKESRHWKSSITANGVRTYLGSYDDKYQAALAYDWAAIELHGKFAKTNFEYDLRA